MARTSLRAALPVFAVVFPTVVGGGILALPIALAPLGPVLAVLATVALGAVNIVTIGVLALAVTRRADSLPEHARMATLAVRLLGRRTGMLTAALVAILMLGLVVAYALGLSHSLAQTIGWSAPVWAILALMVSILLVGFQRRRALTTAGAFVTVANLILLAVLIVILLTHVDVSRLTAGPPTPLGISSFTMVFGALMGAYFGHTSVPTVAPASLRADPTGRSLIVGSVAAMSAATVVSSAWVFVTLGSTPAGEYIQSGSTGIDLVRIVGGPLAGWLALAFVILALGVAGMISAFVLGDLAVEQIPVPRSMAIDLSEGLVLHAVDPAQGGALVILTASGDGVEARAVRGHETATEHVAGISWDAGALLSRVGGRRSGRWLRVSAYGPRIQVRTTLVLEVRYQRGSSATTLLDEGPRARALALLVRRPRTTAELASSLDLPETETATLLADMAASGLVLSGADGQWLPMLGQRRTTVGAGDAAIDPDMHPTRLNAAPRSPAWLATTGAARLVAVAPLVLALVCVLALQSAGATFANFFSLIGLGAFVFVGTVIPLLLAIASRRSADRVVRSALAAIPSWVLWALWGATTITCAAYAAVIYQTSGERIAAAAATVLSLVAAGMAVRAGAFHPTSTLVIRIDASGHVSVALTDGGVAGLARAADVLPGRGHEFIATIDSVPADPLRLVVTTNGAELINPQASGAGRPLPVERDDAADVTWVHQEGAAAPIQITFLVG